MAKPPPTQTHIFGIRHHGPGCARSLRKALEALQPDIILVEGPPEGDKVLPFTIDNEMQPPVALLVYDPTQPRKAAFYPFASYSPEWQAITYGLVNKIPVQFMDLPQAHVLAMRDAPIVPPAPAPLDPPESNAEPEGYDIIRDPLRAIAEAAGYSDGERWWEHMVEQRRDSADLFAGILEIMTALRQAAPPVSDHAELCREAYMRKTIRSAKRKGHKKIAIICGAWHAPALVKLPPAKDDNALLKGLPRTRVAATWVPWTYGRLAASSGYGAGIESPGWYHHLWTTEDQIAIRWMTRVANLLRQADLDASPAQVIDAVRHAEALAALRDRPLPGLPEFNEAIKAVICFGDDAAMRLIHEQLIVSERLGAVPNATPMAPLQQDLQRQQRRLRMKPAVKRTSIELDLRKPVHLERSHLIHRLNMLGVKWGRERKYGGRRDKGTFWERWQLYWQPGFAVDLIEAGMWGNTVESAATNYAIKTADAATELATLTQLVDQVLLADLPLAITHLMTRLQAATAISSDVLHLMEALPPLARALRYGNVRQTDASMVASVIDGIVTRICIGLPGACASLDDKAAQQMHKLIGNTHNAITLLHNEQHTAAWYDVLMQLADQLRVHGLIAGRCTRLLLDAGKIDAAEAARRMRLALSVAGDPAIAAAWVEGFLSGSGLLLLHDSNMWQVLDDWVTSLPEETFVILLPLLRRTFSTFPKPERRQMGERVRRGPAAQQSQRAGTVVIDPERAERVVPILGQLLGLSGNGHSTGGNDVDPTA